MFLFWGIIFFSLILGAAAIIYGKMLLKKEKENAYRIQRGLALPQVPEIAPPPILSLDERLIRIPEGIDAPKDFKIPEIPELSKKDLLPAAPEIKEPETSEPVSPPELPADVEVEAIEVTEPYGIPET